MRTIPQKVADTHVRLRTALAEAQKAGIDAGEAFAASAERTSQGVIADTCGWAWVDVSKPGYHFREAMKLMDSGSHGFRGDWNVTSFRHEDLSKWAGQSITAHEKACIAAREVLQSHFPSETFRVRSRVD